MIDYFYNETELGSGLIADLWRFNASTGIGSFTGNSGANLVSRTISGDNFEDFSLYFTYEKKKSSFNSGAVSLFSNNSGANGFIFGLDSNNFPFLKAGNEGFSFDNFSLGGKNTLCLQKAGNSFSLLRYDVPSSEIYQSQGYFVSQGIELSGGAYRFGSGGISGLNNFYGTVDQLLFLSEKISTEDSLTIFSGFSNLSVTKDIFGTYEVESSEWFIPNSGFTSGLQTLFQDYFTGVYQDYVFDEALNPSTEYIGKITYSDPPFYEAINYYGLGGLGFCQTGANFQMGDPDSFNASGLPSEFEVNLNFTIGPLNPNISQYQPDEMYFTYDLSDIYPGLRFSNLWKLKINESFVQSSNSGYYSGFEMKGVLVPDADLTILGAYNTNFQNVGNLAVFDSVSGTFFGRGIVSGLPVYLNGLITTGVFINSGVIDILNYTELSSDEIIYDRVSGLSLISLSNSSSSLGNFYPGTAFAASGELSFGTMYRTNNFYETHPFHLYHGKDWQKPNSPPIFDNSTGNWA